MLAVWLLGVTILGVILALGARACDGSAEERNSPPSPSRRTRRLARRLRLGKKFPSEFLTHPKVAKPFLCGILRPAIVLPSTWLASAPPIGSTRILAHELGPCPWLDLSSTCSREVVEIGFFFHPGRSLAVAIAEARARALHRRAAIRLPAIRWPWLRPWNQSHNLSSPFPVSLPVADHRHVTGRSDCIPSARY